MFKRSVAATLIFVSLAGQPVMVYADSDPADSTCEIDELMESNRQNMDKMAVGIWEKNLQQPMSNLIETAPNVKDASCLPILDTLDTLIRLRIPSVGGAMSIIFAKLRDMACKYANDFIAGVVGKLNYNISDPYGVFSVGVGATTGEGGVETERYDFSKVVSDAVQKAAINKAKELANEAAGKAASQLPNPTQNRVPRVSTSVDNALKDALNGL